MVKIELNREKVRLVSSGLNMLLAAAVASAAAQVDRDSSPALTKYFTEQAQMVENLINEIDEQVWRQDDSATN